MGRASAVFEVVRLLGELVAQLVTVLRWPPDARLSLASRSGNGKSRRQVGVRILPCVVRRFRPGCP
jgi:hypothetical protein